MILTRDQRRTCRNHSLSSLNPTWITLDCNWASTVKKQQLTLCELQHCQDHNLNVHKMLYINPI
jgi:hypothetical protein